MKGQPSQLCSVLTGQRLLHAGFHQSATQSHQAKPLLKQQAQEFPPRVRLPFPCLKSGQEANTLALAPDLPKDLLP